MFRHIIFIFKNKCVQVVDLRNTKLRHYNYLFNALKSLHKSYNKLSKAARCINIYMYQIFHLVRHVNIIYSNYFLGQNISTFKFARFNKSDQRVPSS